MLNTADLMITSLDVVKGYTLTGVPRFVMDETQSLTIANSEEKTDITGKGGRL